MDVSGVTVGVKHDEQGGVVRSRLDEGLLRELARATRGSYFAASRAGGELVRLASSLGSLARSRRGTRLVERPVARFPLCALLAAGLLVTFFLAPRRALVKRSAPLERGRARASAALALVLVLGAVPARAQSDWARGDAAFKHRDWARAESLYALRARQPRPAAALLVNLATTRAQQAGGDSVERQLSHLSTRADAAGQMAGYNLGTLLGRRNELNRAMGELRRALERDPGNADARWNYELLKLRKDEAERKSKPKPDPQQQGGDEKKPPPQNPQAGQGQPQPDQPPPPAGQNSQSPPSETPPAPGMQQPMTKDQAERLLGSLGDLERLEQQNKRRSRTQREKKGKDW
jgi:Ca-activated chloride channel homolog